MRPLSASPRKSCLLTVVLQKPANYSSKRFITKDRKIREREWSEIAIYLPLAGAVEKRAILAPFLQGEGGINVSEFNLKPVASGGH